MGKKTMRKRQVQEALSRQPLQTHTATSPDPHSDAETRQPVPGWGLILREAAAQPATKTHHLRPARHSGDSAPNLSHPNKGTQSYPEA